MRLTALDATDAREPVAERLARVTLAGELLDDTYDGLRRVLRRQLHRLVPELDLHVADAPTEHHVVAGRSLAVGAALDAEEPDVGDVVLPARVRATRDVDPDAADLGEPCLFERVPDVVSETRATA